MSIQRERLNAEFKRALSDAIRDTIKDPRMSAIFSIANAEITKDQKHAKVFVSLLEEDEDKRRASLEVLNAASGVLGRELNNRIRMRRIPSMRFVIDDSIEYSVRISKVLADLGAAREPGEDAEVTARDEE